MQNNTEKPTFVFDLESLKNTKFKISIGILISVLVPLLSLVSAGSYIFYQSQQKTDQIISKIEIFENNLDNHLTNIEFRIGKAEEDIKMLNGLHLEK